MRIIAFESKFYALKHRTIKNAIVDKDRLSLDKVENLHDTGQIVSTELRIIAFDPKFYALKHGAIKIAIQTKIDYV